MNKDLVVLVPIYNPNSNITSSFLNKLSQKFTNIVIINDGCNPKYNDFFKEIEKEFIVIKHYKNLGKGRAIKTGINYILNNYPHCKCIVTADCDGQHDIDDIERCYQISKKNKNSLILGTRNFNDPKIPFKSRYGNKITKNMFRIFIGININDTQTGLRAFDKNTAIKLLDIPGERYEYETNVLITCQNLDIKIIQSPIKTIYINNNETSHFNPIKDSISIYKLFIKYIFSALSSFAIDIVLFKIFLLYTNNIIISTLSARILSSIYNYLINANLVFKKSNKTSIIKYFILVTIQMFVSGYLVNNLYNTYLKHINIIIIKLLVDIIIFIINFIIQREFIFKRKTKS